MAGKISMSFFQLYLLQYNMYHLLVIFIYTTYCLQKKSLEQGQKSTYRHLPTRFSYNVCMYSRSVSWWLCAHNIKILCVMYIIIMHITNLVVCHILRFYTTRLKEKTHFSFPAILSLGCISPNRGHKMCPKFYIHKPYILCRYPKIQKCSSCTSCTYTMQ